MHCSVFLTSLSMTIYFTSLQWFEPSKMAQSYLYLVLIGFPEIWCWGKYNFVGRHFGESAFWRLLWLYNCSDLGLWGSGGLLPSWGIENKAPDTLVMLSYLCVEIFKKSNLGRQLHISVHPQPATKTPIRQNDSLPIMFWNYSPPP